jgi:ABC-type dipeptide/oligopeptide/nickel transport system permease component
MKRLLILFFLNIWNLSVFAQCAMCKSGVASNLEAGGNTGRGINTGILYLMAIPYILIGALMIYVFRKQLTEKINRIKTSYFKS